ncbi:hypothetical protein [Catenuloplanes japonicus]|uniref:hypothetical protein n=1 Tax=Catenuloplanes japonicus TaxID=33876 RepID=UPI000526206C|nr:hypothetical protein [Catenuloplanes japonicus]
MTTAVAPGRTRVLDEAVHTGLTCAADCGWPLHPAAAAGGFSTHPGCDLPDDIPQADGWRCIRESCPGAGPAAGDHDAILRIRQHERTQHPTPRRGRRR